MNREDEEALERMAARSEGVVERIVRGVFNPPDRGRIVAAAERAGLVRTEACCGVAEKFCASDVWRGNLEAFAYHLLRKVPDDDGEAEAAGRDPGDEAG